MDDGFSSGAAGGWRGKVRWLKGEIAALVFAYKDPRVPWWAKVFVCCVVAYALSPVDLIPDFVPVLGYLDDLIILPVGIWLALKMIPAHVLADCRKRVEEKTAAGKGGLGGRAAAAVIIFVWIVMLGAVVAFLISTV